MKKIAKMAAEDANRWAYAEMFFGKGAGTRRKLLNVEIVNKSASIPGYSELFDAAYAKQPFADLAIKAAKERKRIDGTNVLSKNIKALARGDARGLSTVVIAGIAVYYVANLTGYDKVAAHHAQKAYFKTKAKINQLSQERAN